MSDPRIEHVLDRVRAAGAAAADVLLIDGDSIEARVRATEIDFVKQAHERTLGIRAFVDGPDGLRTACTSTSDLGTETLDRMADETVALARATAPDPDAGLPEGGFADDPGDLGLRDDADRHVAIEARIDEARRAEQAARETDPRIVNSEGSQVESSFYRVAYGNTAGFLGAYDAARHGLFCEPVARENGGMQRDYWMTTSRRLADLEDAAAVGRRAAERAVRRLGARQIATCEVPVIFEPLVARSLLGHLAGCVNGGAVYRQSSFLAGRVGETIASERLTVIDDGRLPGGLGSRPFDGEGQATRRNVILQNGRLETYLLDHYSARKLGLATTGNASRGAGGSPSPAPTNLWIEPGQGSLADIIAETDRGLLVTELIGMGFNPVTGDYSRGAAGLWIEAGEIKHAVEEITIAGHLGEMLAAIDRVGSDLVWMGPQAAPTLRVAQMMVAGSLNPVSNTMIGLSLPEVNAWSERVTMALGMNPGLFTGPGTNTYLVGTGPSRVLLDTGQGVPAYLPVLERAMESAGCREIQEIVLTHGHPDHNGGLTQVLERFGPVPVSKWPWPDFDRRTGVEAAVLADGEVVRTEGATLRAIHTPGHAPDHLCFVLEEEQAIFSGDNVLGVGTTVIPNKDGDLLDYMNSLAHLLEVGPGRIYPAHGPCIEDGAGKLRAYIDHRNDRERQILAALGAGDAPIAIVVKRVYTDVPEVLHAAAGQSVASHLRKLEREGRAQRLDDASVLEAVWSLT